jgi:hypothetical protein
MARNKTLYGKNVVQVSRASELPAFRFPEADIQGLETIGDTSQLDFDQDLECLPPPASPIADIGVPVDLQVEGAPRIIKKGTTSFVDVDISFVPSDGAVRHQFRISKVVAEE